MQVRPPVLHGAQAAIFSPLALWGNFSLDENTFQNIDPQKLIDLLCDISPDISLGLWQFIRMVNPGCTVAVTNRGRRSKAGEEVIRQFLVQHQALTYDSLDATVNRITQSIFMRGAGLTELIQDADLSPRFLSVHDPAWIAWRWNEVERLWVMGQATRGVTFTPITSPLVRYAPLDPVPGSPLGRSMVAPAVFIGVFLISVLMDLKRVIQQQGWPRIDISLDMEKIRAAMPPSIASDPSAFKQWAESTVKEVQAAYAGLQPDDVWIHTDDATVNSPVGTMADAQLGAISGIIQLLERQVARGVKLLPTLLGSVQSRTETQATIEWEIVENSIVGLRQLIRACIEPLLSEVLRLSGMGGRAILAFDVGNSSIRSSHIETARRETELIEAMKRLGLWPDDIAAQWAKRIHDVILSE